MVAQPKTCALLFPTPFQRVSVVDGASHALELTSDAFFAGDGGQWYERGHGRGRPRHCRPRHAGKTRPEGLVRPFLLHLKALAHATLFARLLTCLSSLVAGRDLQRCGAGMRTLGRSYQMRVPQLLHGNPRALETAKSFPGCSGRHVGSRR